jgi:hypothetical protein
MIRTWTTYRRPRRPTNAGVGLERVLIGVMNSNRAVAE